MRITTIPPYLVWVQWIAAAWKCWRDHCRRSAELAGCDPFGAGRMAHDLGVSAAELRVLASRNEDAANLLHRRLGEMKLRRKVNATVMRDLERCCSNCDSKGLCEHELEDRPKSASWPKYCPNELTLSTLVRAERH